MSTGAGLNYATFAASTERARCGRAVAAVVAAVEDAQALRPSAWSALPGLPELFAMGAATLACAVLIGR